jgi:hypothetical protein
MAMSPRSRRDDGYGNWPRGPRRRWRPRRRRGGCLLWVVVLILIVIVLAIMFGGFQKGAKVNSMRYYQSTATQIAWSAGQITAS